MLEYANLEFQIHGTPISEPLGPLDGGKPNSCRAGTCKQMLVEFLPDPDAEKKGNRYTKDSEDPWTTTSSLPRFESWDYREILTSGVRRLAQMEPYKTACMLVDVAVVIRMIHLEHAS